MLGCCDNTLRLCAFSFTIRYSFMQQCWSLEPEHRPTFIQLVETLSNSLEGMAGYVHVGIFGVRTQNVAEDQ